MGKWKNRNLIEKTAYSINGFYVAFMSERAIKLELFATCFLTAFAILRGISAGRALSVFLASLFPVVVELINTSVETVIDLLLGPIFREDVKRAKDMLSASVLLSLCLGYGFALVLIFL